MLVSHNSFLMHTIIDMSQLLLTNKERLGECPVKQENWSLLSSSPCSIHTWFAKISDGGESAVLWYSRTWIITTVLTGYVSYHFSCQQNRTRWLWLTEFYLKRLQLPCSYKMVFPVCALLWKVTKFYTCHASYDWHTNQFSYTTDKTSFLFCHD